MKPVHPVTLSPKQALQFYYAKIIDNLNLHYLTEKRVGENFACM